MNILLVDDETTMLQILKQVIHWNQLGIQMVFTAKNAEEARKIMQERDIDMTLCDIEMPQESGLELIQWIQGLYPDVINIILTGHADFNYARSAISLGVYRFLLKPVAFEEVEKTILEAREKIDGSGHLGSSFNEETRQTAVAEVKEYIEKHYNEVITRNQIENLVHLNSDYINREFKKATGYTLMEYIQFYRVKMAKHMLSKTDDTVAQICTKTGYDSPAYFSKIFKKRTGVTPLEFRAGKMDK